MKYEKLKETIKGLGRVIVACSGGVDSTLLLKASLDAVGRENVLAVIASSPIYPEADTRSAERIVKAIGTDCVIVETSQLKSEKFIENSIDRCYYCKHIIIDKLIYIGNNKGFNNITEGSNVDDMFDLRPGSRACRERGVVSPLRLAGLTKKDVREISRVLGLDTADRPSDTCLATRIPYGTPIDMALLQKIERSELFIKGFGIQQVRVRCHGNIARIETAQDGLDKVIENRKAVAEKLREYGFIYITLDLEGYRSGSMNETV